MTQFSNQVIQSFGLHVFDLSEFDLIDQNQIDIINLRITPAETSISDGLANFNAVYFYDDEFIYTDGFD